ncbi:hypothetical protein EDD29_0841 [Actinocorallia herbida]|uniref:Uncharacterized protein n=1 Tax=Actinocorallia herbida TaxID=58109 RepID=A0A3N1CPU8_9ACTN|nr:hypothetical protein [Actinocorallia herbida]ROO83341.1 hypothetical protein EDD29_0841 [Actinocorallia herbida]
MHDGIELDVEWACADPGEGLRHGPGELRRGDFERVLDRYAVGTPEDLPQVTIAWLGQDVRARVCLIVHEPAPVPDRYGRRGVRRRVFCVPYAGLALGRIGYTALYGALAGVELPAEGALAVSFPKPDPRSTERRPDDQALTTAALLLTGEPVAVLDPGGLDLAARIGFLDDVAAMLPFGLRARLSVSTWVSATVDHGIRLSFARTARSVGHAVVWGRHPDVPESPETPQAYLDLLAAHSRRDVLVRTLAAITGPMSFKRPEAVLHALDGAVRPPEDSGARRAAGTSPVRPGLDRLAAALRTRAPGDLAACLADLKALSGLPQPVDHRAERREIIGSYGLLGAGIGRTLPDRTLDELYEVLLALSVGTRMTADAVEEARRMAGTLHGPLVRVMRGKAPDGEAAFDALLRPEERRSLLAWLPLADLLDFATRRDTDAELFLEILDLVEERRREPRPGADPEAEAAAVAAFAAHRYLGDAVMRRFPADGARQFQLFDRVLRAAHPGGLGPAEFAAVAVPEGPLPPPALLAAALDRCEGDARALLAEHFGRPLVDRLDLPPARRAALLDRLAPDAQGAAAGGTGMRFRRRR